MVITEWQLQENDMKSVNDEIPGNIHFLPLHWLVGGYRLSKLTKTISDYLENRKEEHMGNLGYTYGGNGGYDEGLERTARVTADNGASSKYGCEIESV